MADSFERAVASLKRRKTILDGFHNWPIAELRARRSQPWISSAFHPEADIGLFGWLVSAFDPKRSVEVIHAKKRNNFPSGLHLAQWAIELGVRLRVRRGANGKT